MSFLLPPPDILSDLLAGAGPGSLGALPPGGEASIDGILAPPSIPSPRQERIRARIRDYDLKKAPRKPRPKVDWVLTQKTIREQYWQNRNIRMDLDEKMYLLSDAKDGPVEGEEDIRRVTPRATVDKLSYMVGRQKDKIECKPRASGQEWEEAAQNVEDFLYEMRRAANEKHQARLNQGLGRDEAWFAACRGWLVSRVSLDPGEDCPILIELMDGRNCLPQPGRAGPGMLIDMIYAEKTDKHRFISMNPWAADHEYIQELDDDDEIEWVWYEDAHHSIILVDDMPIRSVEHGYGFCPWVVTISGGAPLRTDLARGQFGSGVLTPLRHTIGYVDRLLSSVATDVLRMGNPPTLTRFNSEKGGAKPPPKLDFRAGVNNVIDDGQGQGHDVLSLGARPDHLQIMYEAMQEDVQRQGVLGVLWGNAEGMASGFHQAVAVNAAEDALFPVTDCIIQHRQWQNRLALNLILCADEKKLLEPVGEDEETEADVPGVLYRRPNRQPGVKAQVSKREPESIYAVLTPEDIHAHGTENRVSLRRMTPQDMLALIQAGAMAVQAKLLSLDYIRREWLDVDDPVDMNLHIMYELIYQDEEIMREYFMPMVLRYLDPELFSFFEAKEEERKAREAAAASQSAMMGAGGPPLPGPQGIPSQYLPPEMQAQPMPGAGDPAAFDAMMAELMNQVPPQI